ncbi:MAG TPA: DUF3570 domain-containing protein [Pseudomonadota bacterium]|nr:DUF3570 domain-containing protein [Pseudomonadota bacterium]
MRLQLIAARVLFVLGCLLASPVDAQDPGTTRAQPAPTAAASEPTLQVSATAPESEPPPAGEKAPPPPAEPRESGPRPVTATVDARTGVYQDSDHTTISTSTIAARALIKDRVEITGRYLIDVVSSASVDVVTAATAAFRENRHEATGGVGYRDGTNSASAGYVFSRENDWQSHTIELGGSRDILQHNLTIGFGASLIFNDIWRSGDNNFKRSLNVYGGSLSLAGTPSRRDVVSLTYSLSYLSGYQASPYRYVLFNDEQGFRQAVPENAPGTRQRHAVAVRWKRHVFRNSAVHTHLRGYFDDWQVASFTFGGEYLIGVGDFVISPHLRGYAQKHAGFYQAQYTQLLNFMTFDRELSSFIDGFAGVRAAWLRPHLGPLDELRVELKVDGFGFYFFDFPRLQSRYGLIAELALGVSL